MDENLNVWRSSHRKNTKKSGCYYLDGDAVQKPPLLNKHEQSKKYVTNQLQFYNPTLTVIMINFTPNLFYVKSSVISFSPCVAVAFVHNNLKKTKSRTNSTL